MNMQAMMQQAQKLQRDMTNAKKEVESKTFLGKSALVSVEVNGKKEITKVLIDKQSSIEISDIEMLEDMILVAVNSAISSADKEMEEKMGKINPGLNGLF